MTEAALAPWEATVSGEGGEGHTFSLVPDASLSSVATLESWCLLGGDAPKLSGMEETEITHRKLYSSPSILPFSPSLLLAL